MVKKIKDIWIDTDPRTRKEFPSAILLGAADDRGVSNVGGRLGAASGPQAIRNMLSEFMLGINGELEKITLLKGNDLSVNHSVQTPTIEQSHDLFRQQVRDALCNGIVPIVLGGGHDYGYPHVAGAHDVFKNNIALVNIDAHLDVRPPTKEGITSGSPFYLAIESGVLNPENFVEFGIQPHCNDFAFYKYLQKKKAKIIFLNEARKKDGAVSAFKKILKSFKKVVVNFDLDAVAMAFSPGVSAPQADGFTSAEFLEMAEISGQMKNVVSVGFFEVAPFLDHNQMTVRLATTAVHRFLCGLSQRIK